MFKTSFPHLCTKKHKGQMVELCSTQHFGGINKNMIQSACTGLYGNAGVILPVDWGARLSAPWL